MSEVVEQEIVEAAPVEGETASESAAEEQQEPQDEAPKPKGGFQKKIDKLTRNNTQLEQEKEYWRQQALRTVPAIETPKAPKSDAPPSEDDFQTHAEFVRATVQYETKKALETERASQRTTEATAQQQRIDQDHQKRVEEFVKTTPDFQDVLEEADAEGLKVSDGVIAEVKSSEHGPALLYYLAKNPDEARRLSTLSPMSLAREVGRIESRFTTSQTEKPAKTTAAPPPPTPTGKSSATSTKDPGEMSPAEYRVWRAKQNAK
jgi:hypothetical protein